MLVEGDNRGYLGQTKWYVGFDSLEMLGAPRGNELEKRSLGFDTLLSNSVTLYSQQGHPSGCVMPCQ